MVAVVIALRERFLGIVRLPAGFGEWPYNACNRPETAF